MKKLLLSLALIFCCTFGIFAQKAFTPSTKSYVNVPILKVFEHRDAYALRHTGQVPGRGRGQWVHVRGAGSTRIEVRLQRRETGRLHSRAVVPNAAAL